MSENRYDYKDLTPFKWFVLENFPFIEADFDALTEWQLFCKLGKEINKIIESQNSVGNAVEEYTDKFIVLKNYVDNYFNNLDVQDEIDNKLNQMVIDGVFQDLLNVQTQKILNGKVDKDGVGQITAQNLSQSAKELITGGNIPVVGYQSVGSYNIIPNSLFYNDLSPELKNNIACLPSYSRKYLLFEQGRRDTSADISLQPNNNCVTSVSPFKVGYSNKIIKILPGFTAYFIGIYNGNKITIPGVTTFSNFNNQLFSLATTVNYENINEFYLEIRKEDQTQPITPTEAINSYELYELNDKDINKIEYNSISNDMQKFLFEDETYIKPYADILVGTPSLTGAKDFKFIAGNLTGNNINRGWVTTPLYLPRGTEIKTENNWQFIIITKESRNLENKVYYPNSYTNNYVVENSGDYYLSIKKADNSNFWNDRNDFIDSCTIKLPSKRLASKDTFYVSENGNDTTGDGSLSHPFRQISKALSSGAKIIFVSRGTYQPFNITADNIEIYGEHDTYATDNLKERLVTITSGIKLTFVTSNNLLTCNYTATQNSALYKCFISQTKNFEDDTSTRSHGYYISIYSKGNKDTSHRYIPVSTLTECSNKRGTYFYDGNKITLNPHTDNNSNFEYYLVDSDLISNPYLCNIGNSNNVTIENIRFEYTKNNLLNVNKSSNIKIKNCEFVGSSLNNNVGVNNANIELIDCVSYLSRNDGYNFHGFGASTISNCIGCNCFDDGISHHDGTISTITGGEYYGNNKGGISTPTYGAESTINGSYMHNNGYGIYAVSDNDHEQCNIYLSNCLITNNTIGITLTKTKGAVFNNTLKGNNSNITGNHSCVVANNTILP